jgi:uroporphyrinogen-III synthase
MTEARRVAIVKSAGRADVFADAIREAGFVPVLVSPFRDEVVAGGDAALAAALAEKPRWIAVTSPHAARALEPHAASLRRVRVAAVGPGTATALHSIGVEPEVVGDEGGESLARGMVAAGLAPGDVVVHPCAADARPELGRTLSSAGATVLSIPVYRMVADPVGERAAAGEFAAVVVGSPRLAERAAALFPSRPPAVAVGRTTAAALRDLGWTPAQVAATPTPADVAGALARALR